MKRNQGRRYESLSKKNLIEDRKTSLFMRALPQLALEKVTGGENSIILLPPPEPPPPIRG